MSLILDALKQSEGDRQDAAGTIGLSAYNQPVKHSKNWITWLLGSILLVNIIVLGWYLFSSVSKPEAPVKETPPKIVTPAAPVAPKMTREPVRQVTPVAVAPAPKAVRNPLPTRPLSAEIGNTKKPAEKLAAIENTPTPKTLNPTAAVSTPDPVDKTPLESVSQNKVPPSPPATPQQPVAEPFGTDILRLVDVDDSVRIKLAAYEINAHVYSDVPEKRFALINMQRIEEGDSLSNSGYKLIEILPTGLVFDYGKGRVLLPLNH